MSVLSDLCQDPQAFIWDLWVNTICRIRGHKPYDDWYCDVLSDMRDDAQNRPLGSGPRLMFCQRCGSEKREGVWHQP